MCVGGILAIISGEIGIIDALYAIDPDVMLFLFGMFIVGEAVCESGYVGRVFTTLCRVAGTKDRMLILFIAVMAGSSAVLMNDTVAIIGVPLALLLCLRYNIPPVAALITLCFAVTTGSVPSPIGNPQNLLIVSYWNPDNPFLVFFSGLFIPTLLSLALVFLIMRGYWHEGKGICLSDDAQKILTITHPSDDFRLTFATRLALLILGVMIVVRIIGPVIGVFVQFPLGYIAMAASLPVLIFARQRFKIISAIDWRTLVFFASMFVLMQSVYDSGWFQVSIPISSMTSVPLLLTLGIILSQFISNVPFIALFQPVVADLTLSTSNMLALAAGSTIAGNLTILGAASNVIVVQQAEKYGVHIGFYEFFRAGFFLTIIQAAIYAIWLMIF